MSPEGDISRPGKAEIVVGLVGAAGTDAIAVDPAKASEDKVLIRRFVGVGPPRYLDLFSKPRRKNSVGDRVDWDEAEATPRLVKTETAYLANEEEFIVEFQDAIERVELQKEG